MSAQTLDVAAAAARGSILPLSIRQLDVICVHMHVRAHVLHARAHKILLHRCGNASARHQALGRKQQPSLLTRQQRKAVAEVVWLVLKRRRRRHVLRLLAFLRMKILQVQCVIVATASAAYARVIRAFTVAFAIGGTATMLHGRWGGGQQLVVCDVDPRVSQEGDEAGAALLHKLRPQVHHVLNI